MYLLKAVFFIRQLLVSLKLFVLYVSVWYCIGVLIVQKSLIILILSPLHLLLYSPN